MLYSVMWAVQFPQGESEFGERIAEFPLTHDSSSDGDLWTADCREKNNLKYRSGEEPSTPSLKNQAKPKDVVCRF